MNEHALKSSRKSKEKTYQLEETLCSVRVAHSGAVLTKEIEEDHLVHAHDKGEATHGLSAGKKSKR